MDGLLGSGVLLESSVSIDEEDNAGRSDEARCLSYKRVVKNSSAIDDLPTLDIRREFKRHEYMRCAISTFHLLDLMNSEHYVLFGLIASGRDDAGTHSIALALFAVQARRLNVHQRSLEAAGLELCGGGGSVPQGQPSSAGSVGSAPSPASPRPTPQPRPPLATTTSQPSRTLDDDRSTDVGAATAAEDSDDGESRAQYVSANCVVFTHYRGDAASEVEEHFQRALAHDKPKGVFLNLVSNLLTCMSNDSNSNKCSSKTNQSTKEKLFGIHEKEAANVQSRLASTTASSFGRKREALVIKLKTWLCGNAGVGGSKLEKIVEHRGGDRGIVVEAEEEEEKRKRGKRIRRNWRWGRGW
ncbi:hypothetical protein HZH68_011507 [Vespula germanica]|uniref:Uncharacterized protein n=1 Tax=Vespula germanica TaxID=30212 RepID=A0A834JS59_VESGE|nr:hypothetical protein HZH68_011507 [Vespula germanica]